MVRLIEKLNLPDRQERIEALKRLGSVSGAKAAPVRRGYTNNHVHTTYSFSPYTPAMAVWLAYQSGLETVGIIDHDSVGGIEEFIQAGELLGIATTSGFEMRTDWSGTALRGKRLNNPDQLSSAYICAHGLPRTQIAGADEFLRTVRCERGKRERKMTETINRIFGEYGIFIDYDADVIPCSYAPFGGEITERHLLYALSQKMVKRYGKGKTLSAFVTQKLGIALNAKQRDYLEDENNGTYEYDLLNVLKAAFMPRIYIDAEPAEMPPVSDAVKRIKALGAIPTYCYLGDVAASPTGDKKAQKFEDDYLEDVFKACRELGFEAFAFMPSRNTKEQLEKVMSLCDRYGFMQVSGEDINQPRQSFICEALGSETYRHLADAAWALVGHERSAASDIKRGIFAEGKALALPQLYERIRQFKEIGKSVTGGNV